LASASGPFVAAGVQLGAVAGRQQHRFLHAGLCTQRRQRLPQRIRAERHRFAQGNRRGLVVDAEDIQAHGAWRWLWCATNSFSCLR